MGGCGHNTTGYGIHTTGQPTSLYRTQRVAADRSPKQGQRAPPTLGPSLEPILEFPSSLEASTRTSVAFRVFSRPVASQAYPTSEDHPGSHNRGGALPSQQPG